MSYEHLREQLRPKHARVRAVELGAVAMVGVVGAVSLVWLGPFEDARGLRNPVGLHSAAQAEKPSPGEPVLAFVSLRPTLP